MKNTKLNLSIVFIFIYLFASIAFAQEADTSLVVDVGDKLPEFSLTTTDGVVLTSEDFEGKVVLLNFFATWCPPCREEMPEFESKLWPKFKDEDFIFVSIGREHTNKEVLDYKNDKKYSFPMAADPERKIYNQFATAYIPRNFLIDQNGEIVYCMVGYSQTEFDMLMDIINNTLKSRNKQ